MKKLKKNMRDRRYRENNKAKIAAYNRKKYAENKEYRENKLANQRNKYAEDEEYREKRKMSVQGYKKDNKAKIAAYKRKKYADNKEYRETQVAKERNKYAENQREAGMELDEVREKELFEQMMTAQANLLKHVADVVVVCRAQCERLQQPRA